jgi:hypothetical protein
MKALRQGISGFARVLERFNFIELHALELKVTVDLFRNRIFLNLLLNSA